MSDMRSVFGKVGILAGGKSSEREISLRSGSAVFNALIQRGVDAILLDAADDLEDIVLKNKIDVAFVALHGKFGEDGTVQKVLEDMRIPYTGSGPEASCLAFDKIASKKIFMRSDIRVPKYVVFERCHFNPEDAYGLGFPVVVKPNLEGSSIGLSIVREKSGLIEAAEIAFKYCSKVLVEEYINGRELTVGILGDKALPVIEIVARDKLYDYKAKYSDPETRYLVPAPVDSAMLSKAQRLGIKSHRVLGCRCFSRVDIMMGTSGELYVLEVNTIPGMTERSLLPKAAEAAGLSFGDLCVTLIKDASERYGAALSGKSVKV